MAYEESLRSITLTSDNTLAVKTGVSNAPGSAVDNAGNQYRFVTIKGEHLAGLADNTTRVLGVLQNKPQVPNEAATVGFHGVSKVRVDGAITAGTPIYAAADGRGTATAGTGNGAGAAGITLQSSSAADELVAVLLTIGR